MSKPMILVLVFLAHSDLQQLWSFRAAERNDYSRIVRLRAICVWGDLPDPGNVCAVQRMDQDFECATAFCAGTSRRVERAAKKAGELWTRAYAQAIVGRVECVLPSVHDSVYLSLLTGAELLDAWWNCLTMFHGVIHQRALHGNNVRDPRSLSAHY